MLSSTLLAMGLADTFQTIVDSLPDDWTDLELDLRIADESRYVDAAVYLTTCNAKPYSHNDWHWRLPSPIASVMPLRRPRFTGRSVCWTMPAWRASWWYVRCAQAVPRSHRCGAARSRCATNSAACARSR